MAVQLQIRRGNESENDAFTGALGEITVDTTTSTIRVHDGSTVGGIQSVSLDAPQTLTNKTLSSPTFSGEITGSLVPSSDITFDLGSPSNRWNDLFLSGDTIDLGGATISVVDGSFEFRDSGGNNTSISLDANTTDDLAEGTNLYYTDARVDSHLSGGSGIDYSTGTISHSDTSSQSSVDNSGNTVIQDITLDGFGHITGLSSKTIDPPTLSTLGLDTNDDVQFDSLGIGTSASDSSCVETLVT